MPRISKRQQVINRLNELTLSAIKHSRALRAMGLDPSRAEDFMCELRTLSLRIQNRRYLFGRQRHRKRQPKFDLFLNKDSDDCLSDREFLHHFRLSRDIFWQLVRLIQDHSSFQRKTSDSRGKSPRPCECQLLVLLKYFGCEGNAASSIGLGNFFGVASGAVDDYRNNALEALLSIEDRTYYWPSLDERRLIASRIMDIYYFPNCVGLIDGTPLPLSQRPLVHGENYLSRKRFYAIVMLVVCDDQARITHYHIGWPGSAHDNRVWRNSRPLKKCAEFFGCKECLLGDSAFTASATLVPPFKNPSGSTISANQTEFNALLAKPRVKSEHCIGILKGRFPHLKCTRQKIGNEAQLKRVIDYVRGTVVLHNFLINEPIENDWLNNQEGDDDLLPESAANATNEPDYSRRQELMYYLSELPETSIN